MAKSNASLLAFNRGRISSKALARLDFTRTALSADVMTNWMPRILGSMALSVGWEYKDSTYNNDKAFHIPFVYALSDQAIIELTDAAMRVRVNDTAITRPSVTTTMTNSSFATDVTGWTDADESGCTSQWVTGGYLGLTGTETNYAIRRQQVTVSGGNVNVEHGLRVVVERGVVTFKVGSSSGGEQYVATATLRAGEYSFAFTPTGDFHISIASNTKYQSLVSSISIESSGAMVIPTDWLETDLPYVRHAQSGDVIFVACKDNKQYKIERRATRSWGISEYLAEDGPFLTENITPTTLTPSALSGDITLTASKALFSSGDVGRLYRLTTTGQTVTAAITAENTFTDPVRITGSGSASRTYSVSITGTWVGTVMLQRSIGDDSTWVDTTHFDTANTSYSDSDNLDNQIVYYRIGVKTGQYTSGTINVSLVHSLGTSTGVVRITSYSSETSVSGVVLDTLGGTTATQYWNKGAWSDTSGYPSAVALYEGRLWWAGKDNVWASISDSFESFDDSIEGDSGTISRTLGEGSVDNVNWLLGLQRLIIGVETGEKIARSTSLDEPLTPTQFNIKTPSTKGSTAVAPVKVDSSGMFVRNNRLFHLLYGQGEFDYSTIDLTAYVPEIGGSGFVKLAVQRYPDTRVHAIKSDGTAAVLIFDANEDVKAWVDIETDGDIEDVIVMPATATGVEDSVYYAVKRNINGSDVRYLEKWALESECVGGTQNKQAHAFKAGTQASSATITGLSHLEGEEVIVWANGKNYSPRVSGVQTTFTVTSGSITLPEAVTSYVVGLPYKARFKSTKLAYAAGSLTANKKIDHLGVIMENTHNRGLRYGSSFDALDELPLIEDGKDVVTDSIHENYDKEMFEFDGVWETDSRLCLEAMAPMPVTLLACVMKVEQ